jgi:hypothetical protein
MFEILKDLVVVAFLKVFSPKADYAEVGRSLQRNAEQLRELRYRQQASNAAMGDWFDEQTGAVFPSYQRHLDQARHRAVN